MSDDTPSAAQFTYLHLRTAYGPGGGPGSLAAYTAAAQGYTALACTDYGTVAAWPEWERACRKAGIRPIYGLVFDLAPAGAAPGESWPLLALAATGQGLRNLVQIHNRLEAHEGRALLPVADLPPLAAGLWLILLPSGDHAPAPLVALPRQAAVAAVARLAGVLPRAEALLCGLPVGPEQDYFAQLAADIDLPALALPAVRYPSADAAPAHAVLRAAQQVAPATADAPPADPAVAALPHHIESPDRLAERYTAHPDALRLVAAVAESCRAELADLRAPGFTAAGQAALEAAIDEALAAEGCERDAHIAAELAAVHRLGLADALTAARRVAAAARGQGLLLGAPGGLIAEGRLPMLLGLAPPDPFGAPARWLATETRPGGWTPALAVPAGRRNSLVAFLQSRDGAPRATPASDLLPAGGRRPLGVAGALAAGGRVFDLAPATRAALETAWVQSAPATRARRWQEAAPELTSETAAELLPIVTALAEVPGPPLADAEVLLVVPPDACLPLVALPDAPGLRAAAWSAADCEALGASVVRLWGDPGLDLLQRGRDLAAEPLPAVPTDAMRLLLSSGDIAGLPLPVVPEDIGDGLETTSDVLAAFCAALLPPDPADVPGWAALGALLYGPRGPHPWLRTYLRRRVGGAPVTYHFPDLAPALDLTWGLPLYCEQVAILQLLQRQDGVIPPQALMQVQEWLGQAETWAVGYSAAVAAAERLHLALRLKVTHPAAFLAAALESAVLAGDTPAETTLTLEARRQGIELRPPDIQTSAAGFALEAPAPRAVPPATEPANSRRPQAPPPLPAIRWGLAPTRGTLPAATALVAARATQPDGRFASLAALCLAAVVADVSPSFLAVLIRAGACDSLGGRSALLAALPAALAEARQTHAAQQVATTGGQAGMFAVEVPGEGGPEGENPAASPALDASTEAPVAVPAEAGVADDPDLPPVEIDKAGWRAWEATLIGHTFTVLPSAAPVLGAGGVGRGSAAIARLTLGGVTAAHVGQTVSLVAVLSGIRVVPTGAGGEDAGLAVALAQDAEGALPLILFPPAYARHQALLEPDVPRIVVARVQLAEAWEGRGAGIVLIGEQLLPYQVEREAQELDVTPIKRRSAPAATDGAAKPRKPESDPLQYSAGGQRYFQASRPAPPADPAADAAAAPTTEAGPPRQIVITLNPLGSEQEDEERMRRLKAILLRHPGPTGVMLYFPDDPLVGMPTHMPLKRTVDASEAFCGEVGALLGAGCYEFR
jgi:DNA polymerase-3 subunit alpha